MDIHKISKMLQKIYPQKYISVLEDIIGLIEKWKKHKFFKYQDISEKDFFLITYGDSVYSKKDKPLKTLKLFLDHNVKGLINNIHILPMYPYTSDDGFSVVDYRTINPDLGTWNDIESLALNYDLMFDAVVNHASVSSHYFKKFLAEENGYSSFFVEGDPNLDYSKVVRPRTSPLLTPFDKKTHQTWVWTTFSPDQVDLNFKEPAVLIEMLDILLFYVHHKARYIRLDAVGLLWKELGTTCMHLPETHEIIKLMRYVIRLFTNTHLVTETNVPHQENISYFGNGYDEASMVYQFPLPPLTLHTFLNGNAKHMNEWLNTLKLESDQTTFFNFLSSHDGIGMRPVDGLLSEVEKEYLVNHTIEQGGRINYRSLSDGKQVPYELNITFLDALSKHESTQEMNHLRFLAAHSLLCSVIGVPAVYIHSLVGSRNDLEGALISGINRRISRKKMEYSTLSKDLKNKESERHFIHQTLKNMIRLRKDQLAFHPNAKQEVVFIDDRVISFIRSFKDEKMFVLINVTDQHIKMTIPYLGLDIIQNQWIDSEVNITPYQYLWIKINTNGSK